MAKLRRFKTTSLAGRAPGDEVSLPPEEARHARVLRLKPGDEVEVFDGTGLAWSAILAADGARVTLRQTHPASTDGGLPPPGRLWLATAWPKGKRAAVLVEKCTELGVTRILPLCCARSVVMKAAESEGLARLGRIAAEAAKQCGRSNVPELTLPRSFPQILAEEALHGVRVLLDPGARESLPDVLTAEAARLKHDPAAPLLCLVGPEGGFTVEEGEQADRAGVRRARLGPHALRVETACIAACAVAAAWRLQCTGL